MNRVDPRRPLTDVSIYVATCVGAVLLALAYWLVPEAMQGLLIAGLLVYLGFGLPRWMGREERLARALASQQQERDKWGFHSRDRDGVWINYVDYPLVRKTPYALGRYFYSEWLVIHDGYVVVNPGRSNVDLIQGNVSYDPASPRTYAWDGCTPKRQFYWVALIGTPDWWQRRGEVTVVGGDGVLQTRSTFWPQAHQASLVHDALYQYLGMIPIAKREVDQLFGEMLIESGFPRILAWLYRSAVHRFGATDVAPGRSGSNSRWTVAGLPFLPPRTAGQ